MNIIKIVFNVIKKILLLLFLLLIIIKLYTFIHQLFQDDKDRRCYSNMLDMRDAVRSFLKKNNGTLSITSWKFMEASGHPQKSIRDYYLYTCPKSGKEYIIHSDGKSEIIILCSYHGKASFSVDQ